MLPEIKRKGNSILVFNLSADILFYHLRENLFEYFPETRYASRCISVEVDKSIESCIQKLRISLNNVQCEYLNNILAKHNGKQSKKTNCKRVPILLKFPFHWSIPPATVHGNCPVHSNFLQAL